MEQIPTQKKRSGSDEAYYRFALSVLGDFGVTLALPAVVAAFGGIALDRFFHTAPWLLILCLVLAFVGTFLVIRKKAYRYAKEFDEIEKK